MADPKTEVESNVNSLVGGLFYGEVDQEALFPFPHFTDDQVEMSKSMTDAVNRYCTDNLDSAKMDREGEIPEEVIQGLAELGLYGLAVKEEHGGMELDYSLYARVFGELASFDGSVGTFLGAHQSIGYRALINDGNSQQRDKWLPKLASGEWIAAFCLTEPGSGSDAYSIKTKAVKQADGSYILTGQKLWITNGGRAQFYTVFAKTDHQIEGKTVEKISCFAVLKDMEGVSFGEKEDKMGIRASETRAVYFDKVKIPAENLICDEGQGFKVAMNVLNSGRLSLGSGCVGGMKNILSLATEHAKNRKQFGKTITEFGLIQEKLTRMAANIYAVESMVYLTTGNMVRGMDDYFLESAVCKVFGSERLWETVDMGMQIAAGTGYMREYPYERIMRDSRINLIFEGTNEILRCFIALSGIKGPSEDLKKLGKASDVSQALQDPIKSLGVLTNFARKRIEKMMVSRSLTQSHDSLADYAGKFSSMMSGFAIQVENTLIKYGRDIINHELVQGRLADMAIDLYLMMAVISRTTAILNDEKISEDDKDYCLKLARYNCKEARRRFVANLKGMSKNMDSTTEAICEHVCKKDGYGLDIVDF